MDNREMTIDKRLSLTGDLSKSEDIKSSVINFQNNKP